jgi:hypothetical protein
MIAELFSESHLHGRHFLRAVLFDWWSVSDRPHHPKKMSSFLRLPLFGRQCRSIVAVVKHPKYFSSSSRNPMQSMDRNKALTVVGLVLFGGTMMALPLILRMNQRNTMISNEEALTGSQACVNIQFPISN